MHILLQNVYELNAKVNFNGSLFKRANSYCMSLISYF